MNSDDTNPLFIKLTFYVKTIFQIDSKVFAILSNQVYVLRVPYQIGIIKLLAFLKSVAFVPCSLCQFPITIA